MTTVFIPYPTEVFGEALHQGAGAKTAAIFYSAVMTVNAVAWAALWLYASLGRRLLTADFPESQRRMAMILFSAGTLVYLVSIGIAFIDAYMCLAFHGALAEYYAFDSISRRVGRDLSWSRRIRPLAALTSACRV
ncbi:MAG TPA: hypothetical protein VNC61_04970 [Acidimicrobiales bacterium]|nr:hypothetical protein [Acidimicrobiales bacterium]